MAKHSANVFRILIAFVMLSGLLAPFTTFDARADEGTSSEPTTGILQVELRAADNGQRLGGACWDVTDANGAKHPYCDFDNDGLTSFELVPGLATVTQTGGPEGYIANTNGQQTVTAGLVSVLSLYSAAVPAPVQPAQDVTEEATEAATEEATQEATEVATEEVTEEATEAATEEATEEATEAATEEATEAATEEATEEAKDEPTVAPTEETKDKTETKDTGKSARSNDAPVALANADLFTVTCSFTPQTGLSSFTFSLVKANPGDPDPDAGLTITYQPYDLLMNPLAPIVQNSYTASFPNKDWRQLEISFTRPDGVTGVAEAGCNTTKVNPSITTQPFYANPNVTLIPQMGQVPVGTALRDSASMVGQTVNAGGTATYRLYKGSACTGTPVYEVTVPVQNGVIPDSPAPGYTAPATAAGQGLYNWQVTYNGDTLNNSVTSQCGLESLIIGKYQPSIATVMRIGANGTVVGQNSNIFVDQTISDGANLTGATSNAGGTVNFKLYGTANCSGPVLFEETVTVTNGSVPRTAAHGPLPIGTYNWVAVYSGDTLNEGATSPCGAETFNVVKRSPSVVTTPRRADNNNAIADGGTVGIGTGVYDTAVLNNATSDAGGSVTYNLYSGASCSGTPLASFGPYTVSNGSIPNSTPAYVFNTPGVYNWQAVYTGDARNNGASSTCGDETINVGKNDPTIATIVKNGANNNTIAQNAVIPIPASVYDTATLSGTSGTPTGTVTYRLYKGHLCNSNTLIYTSSALPLNGDGTLPNAPAQNITLEGTYNWVAQYSGDANNNGVTGVCGDEQFHAGKGSGTITTNPRRTNASGTDQGGVSDGATIDILTYVADRSTLAGFTANRGGTITYNLYYENDCTGTPVFSSTMNVVANNQQPNSGHFQVTQAGRYEWQAVYSGDANNQGATSPCGAETFHVSKKTTTTVTTMKAADGSTIADNTTVTLPFTMYDTAVVNDTLSGFGGTITYRLYTTPDCSGSSVVYGPYTITGGVVPPMTGTHSLDGAYIFNWRAEYSGDANHNGSTSSCGGETIFAKAQPTITTGPRAGTSSDSQSAISNNAIIPTGSWVSDTATLSNASQYQRRIDSNETSATVTYRLYLGEECTGTPIFTSTKSLTANSNTLPASDSFPLYSAGIYNWQATYSGNSTNQSAVSACGAERFIIQEHAPVIKTIMRHGPTSGNQSSLSHGALQQLPRWFSDTTVITGLPFGTTGTLTYQLYHSANGQNPCSGTPVFTSGPHTVDNINSLPNSNSFQATAFGTYNWVVTFTPTGNGTPIVSGCGEETFVGVEDLPRQIDISCTYFPDSGTSSFVVTISKLNTSAPDYHPNPNGLTVIVTPLGLNNATQPSITYNNYNSSIGPNNPDFMQKPWRSISAQVTWPDGITGTANAGCNTTKLQPEIKTVMVDAQAGVVANGTELAIGDQIGDTVILTGATVNFGGSFEYKLYNNATCTGTPVYSALKPILTPATMPPSDLHTLTAGGDYNWVVVYSGDIHNESVTSGCGEEFFSVEKNETSIVTTVKVGNTTIPQNGTVGVGDLVNDTAVLSGHTANAGGQVTYALFDTTGCTGNPLQTWTVDVTNGVIPASGTYAAQAGKTYNWVVTYTGDVSNAGSVSACGQETFKTPKLRIVKTNDTGAAEVNPGQQIAFKVVLTNDGPGEARSVSISDTLPTNAGLNWTVDAPASNTGCSITNGALSCAPRNLAAGASITVRVVSTVTAETCGPVKNIAYYGSLNAGEGPSNEAEVYVSCGDVELVKEADNTPIYPGQTAAFTITVTNKSETDVAKDVVITDTLPAGTWTVVTDPANLPQDITNGKLTVTVGDLAIGAKVTVKLSRTATLSDCEGIYNTAQVTSSNEASNALDNNEDDADIDVLCTTVTIVKSPDNGTVYPGETMEFTIVATNTGEHTAKDVVIEDTLPTGTWNVTVDPDTYSPVIANGKLTVNIGDLAKGAKVTVKLSRTATVNDCAGIENVASVYASNDPDGKKQDDAEFDVLCTELELIKTPDGDQIYPGDTATFEIVGKNLGPNLAKNVEIVETLPAGIWSVTTVPANLPTALDGNKLTVTVGDLASGAQVKVILSRTATVEDCDFINNTATISGTNEFPVNPNSKPNTDTGQIEVLCTEIEVEKTPKGGLVAPGDTATFTIEIRNIGENIAKNVVVTDIPPTGSAAAWTVVTNPAGLEVKVIGENFVEIKAGDIPVGGKVTITLSRTLTAQDCYGRINNIVEATLTNEYPGKEDDNADVAWIDPSCSEVSLQKTPDGAVINAGDDAVFTIVARNNGPQPALGVKIVDTLPAGSWTVAVVSAPQGVTVSCPTAPVTGSFTCNVTGALAKDAQITLSVTGKTSAGDICGNLKNVAEVSSTNEIPNSTDNNKDNGDITVNCADLWVEKVPTNGASSINATDRISFTITIHNDGAGAANGVTLSDNLPTGIDWKEDDAACSIANGVLSCTIGTMPAGTTRSVVVYGDTEAGDCREVTNVVTIDATNINRPELGPGEDDPLSAEATVTINCSNLEIDKSTTTPRVSAGDPINFTITVRNVGPGVAYDVTVVDTLPTNVTNWTEDSDSCSIANGKLTCDFGDLAYQGVASVTLTGTTSNMACGEVYNEATVSARNFLIDGDEPITEVSDDETIIVDCPDVVVEKVAESASIFPGQSATFTITVTNLGPGNAKGVKVIDTLPAGEWTVTPDAGLTCNTVGGKATGNFECTVTGDLAPDASLSIQVSRVATTADCEGLFNEVEVSATNEDPTKVDERNEDDASIEVRCSEIKVTKTAAAGVINAGERATFTVVVENIGDDVAKDVVIDDFQLPRGEWNFTAPAGVTCTAPGSVAGAQSGTASGSLVCTVGDLAVEGKVEITLTRMTDASDCGKLPNEVRVTTSNEVPGKEDDNEDDAEIMVNCPDLTIVKVAADNEINAGDPIAFTITVTNGGPGVAKDVVVTDVLPAGIEWSENSDSCSITDGVLSCSFAELAVGASVSVTISGVTDADDCGMVRNTATVDASNLTPTTDENRDQRESTDEVDVNCAYLKVVKTADKAEINAGDAIGFTIKVTNSGEGDAYDVVLTDVLPTQITWTENSDACEIANGTLTCEWDKIAAGASVEVKISGTTDAGDCGVIRNTAMVDGSNLTDENRENEDDLESTDEVTVNCPYLKVVKTADDAEISAGDAIGFTIKVTNSGEGDAYDVVLTDVLPTQIVWTENSDACEIANGTLTCEWDKIAAGASVEVKISGTTDAGDCGVIENTAMVDGSNLTDENRENEDDLESTDEVTVNCSDLVIKKTAVDGEGAERTTPIGPGDEVAFKISVTNTGEGNAYDVVISDNLPAGIDWSIKSVVGSDDSVNVDGCAIVGGVLTCEVGTLAPGASIDVIISGLTPDSLCAPVTNTASVSSSNTTDEEDPSDTATQAMDCNVDIQKVGPDGESPLAGACFTLNNSDVTYGPVCVDENGRARFEMIPVGLYTLTETTVPVGYQRMKSIDIEVEYGDTMLITAVNHRLPLVVKLDCLVDPGDLDLERLASDPTYAPEDCVRVEGVSFTTTVNGQQVFASYVTGPDGTVMVQATTGDKLVITEDINTATPGFLPRENPITIDPVTMEGSVAAFVNLAQDGDLKLLKVVCQSENAQAPIFETLNGALMRVPDGCWRGAGVAFTISGGHLTSPIEITTDRNGEAELSLRFGTYTLTEVSTGASYEVTVQANTTVYVRITNFEPEIPGIDPTPSVTPTPGPKTPIGQLPDTGSGTANGSMLMLLLPMLALLFMVAGAMLATNAKRSRKS